MNATVRVAIVLMVVGYVLGVCVYYFAGRHGFGMSLACDLVPWFAVRRPDWRP